MTLVTSVAGLTMGHAAPEARGERARMLLVGFERGRSAVLGTMLGVSAEIDTAGSFSRALHRLSVASHDGVVVRLSGADPDGVCFVRVVRSHLARGPLVVLTDASDARLDGELRGLGVDGHLREPVPLADVVDRLTALLIMHGYAVPRARRQSRYLRRAFEHLGGHYGSGTTLESVAAAVNVSAGHLGDRFLTETGIPAREWLTRVRVGVAKSLLTETDEKLEVIAELAGFCDASHFSRVFLRVTAVRPGHYRDGAE